MPPQQAPSLIRPIQTAFSSGELSPELYSRVDLAKYSTGLRTCRNFIIHPQGGASNRPGTKFISKTKFADKMARVVRFVFNQTQAYIFEIGDLYIRFYTNQAPIQANTTISTVYDSGTTYGVNDLVTIDGIVYDSLQASNSGHAPSSSPTYWAIVAGATPQYEAGHAYVVGNFVISSNIVYYCIQAGTGHTPASSPTYWTAQTMYEIPSPYGVADLAKLRFESSADTVYITHPDYQQRTLSRFGNADWRLALYSADDGPFMIENIDDSISITASDVTGSIVLTSSKDLFNVKHIGALWKLRHYIQGQTNSNSFSGKGVGTGITCFTTWRIISHGTWTGKFNVEKSTDGGSTWTILRTFSSVNDFNTDSSGTEDIFTNTEPFLVRVNMDAYTSGTANIDITTDPFYQEGIVRITAFTDTKHITATVLQKIGLTTSTTQWAEGSWSNYRGWPAVARFFQDRLCFSGTVSEPMTNWLSAIGDYVSFIRHSTLLDTDGITIPLPTRQINAINGLVTLRKLVAFTSASEWTIGPPTGNVLSPSSVEQLVQGYRGSYGIDPITVGFECIFLQANSKVIRNLQYQLYYDLYTGANLNILSKHLFDKYVIVQMAYQQDPDSIVWCLRDDGVLLGMTYMAEQEVIAWHWHDTGSFSGNYRGKIEDIATIPGEGFDELWMETQRGPSRFIEVMTKRDIVSECNTGERHIRIEDQFFVDCGVIYGENQIRITQITTQGDLITITAPAHGLSNGQIIKINYTAPILGLNGNTYTISDVTANTFIITPT